MEKRVKREYFFLALASFVVAIFICVNISVSYAKYVSEIGDSESSEVAEILLMLSDLSAGDVTYNLMIESLNPRSPQKTYTFSVTNGTEDNFSDIALQYRFHITKTDNLPLNVTLKDEDANNLLTLSPANLSDINVGWYTMKSGEYCIQDYSLTVAWNTANGNDSSIYQNIIDLIQIKVEYVQID